MFIVNIDGIDYKIAGTKLTGAAVASAKAQAVAMAAQAGRRFSKRPKITVEFEYTLGEPTNLWHS